ncbi:MAG TPA: phosphopantetheine-binding protein [Patescibacteria group bacterium]|jgi:acyl carrier protein|nr:phosphopantetheine-binding protein [Patescibacteria group bacterium]
MASNASGAEPQLRQEIKEFIVTQLRLKDVTSEQIRDDESLVEGTLGLDSIDFLELTVAMEKHYGIKITEADQVRQVFESVRSIADHIAEHRARTASA